MSPITITSWTVNYKSDDNIYIFKNVDAACKWLLTLEAGPNEDKIEKKFDIDWCRFAVLLPAKPTTEFSEPCQENLGNSISHHAQLVCLSFHKRAEEFGEKIASTLVEKYKGCTINYQGTDANINQYSCGVIVDSDLHPKWTKGFLPEIKR